MHQNKKKIVVNFDKQCKYFKMFICSVGFGWNSLFLGITLVMSKIGKSTKLDIIINIMNMECYSSTLIKFYRLILQLCTFICTQPPIKRQIS